MKMPLKVVAGFSKLPSLRYSAMVSPRREAIKVISL